MTTYKTIKFHKAYLKNIYVIKVDDEIFGTFSTDDNELFIYPNKKYNYSQLEMHHLEDESLKNNDFKKAVIDYLKTHKNLIQESEAQNNSVKKACRESLNKEKYICYRVDNKLYFLDITQKEDLNTNYLYWLEDLHLYREVYVDYILKEVEDLGTYVYADTNFQDFIDMIIYLNKSSTSKENYEINEYDETDYDKIEDSSEELIDDDYPCHNCISEDDCEDSTHCCELCRYNECDDFCDECERFTSLDDDDFSDIDEVMKEDD